MPKRDRSGEKSAGEADVAVTKVQRSEESGRRFQAYIGRWRSEVDAPAVRHPSESAALTDMRTILALAAIGHDDSRSAQSSSSAACEPMAIASRASGGLSRAPSRAATGVVYDEAMLKHVSEDPKDYERPVRLSRTIDHLRAVGLLDCCTRLKARLAKTKELRRVHTRDHIDFVDQLDFFMSLKKETSSSVGQDLYVCEHTSEASRYAAGCTAEAARAVVRGEVASAFAIVRPPGHHAGPETPSGFCFYNNVAVAARAAQEELVAMQGLGSSRDGGEVDPSAKPRVLILDWDVHHCDGTEDIFYEDPSVLVVSIHQYANGRGHAMRKTATAAAAPSDADLKEMSLEALTALLPDGLDVLLGEAGNSAVAAEPGDIHTPTSGGEAGIQGRRRPQVDYNKLATELEADDAAAAAMFGLNLSDLSPSSSDSDSSSGSDGDGIDGPVRYAGDTDGLSCDDVAADAARGDAGEDADEQLYYPCTGHLSRIGGETEPAALGRNINVPWPAHGFGDLEYLRIVQEVVIPAGLEFQPSIVIVSCGFDSARGDLLGSMNLSASGYYAMTKLISAHFPRLVIALEGGYHVSNVARCSEAVMRALLEDASRGAGAGEARSLPPSRMLWCQTGQLVDSLRVKLGPYWKCFAK